METASREQSEQNEDSILIWLDIRPCRSGLHLEEQALWECPFELDCGVTLPRRLFSSGALQTPIFDDSNIYASLPPSIYLVASSYLPIGNTGSRGADMPKVNACGLSP